MKLRVLSATSVFLLASLPNMYGFSSGPPADRVGLDGAASCTACHRIFGTETQQLPNADARGSIRIETKAYVPGVKQVVRVAIAHPDAMRWGFEITALLASDTTKGAGTFVLDDTAPVKLRLVEAAGKQFVTHIAVSTFAGTRNGAFWDIEWTPPATASGDVLFVVAGNAANGNGNNREDRIYTTQTTVKPAVACNLTTIPQISVVLNGASQRNSGVTTPRTLDSGFTANSELTVWGTGFQASGNTTLNAGYLVGRRLPTELGCVGVSVAGQPARLSFAGSNQINAQVPTVTDQGLVPVMVILNPGTANERRSAISYLRLDPYAPSLFAFMGTNFAAARFQDGTPVGTIVLAENAKAAKVGDTIAIYANGLGATDPAYNSGDLVPSAAKITGPLTVIFNGAPVDPANIQYAGLSPGSPSSLYQINLKIPANARKGANSIRLQQGSFFSQEGVTLEVQ
jgi:uncharacterized protein (TIGR03437 family)